MALPRHSAANDAATTGQQDNPHPQHEGADDDIRALYQFNDEIHAVTLLDSQKKAGNTHVCPLFVQMTIAQLPLLRGRDRLSIMRQLAIITAPDLILLRLLPHLLVQT